MIKEFDAERGKVRGKKSASLTCAVFTGTTMQRQQPERYSSWSRLLNVTTYVHRFADNCRLSADLRRSGPISAAELRAAERVYMKQCQDEAFPQEVKELQGTKGLQTGSKLAPSNPTLDEHGFLRCDGRLRYAKYPPWEARYPIILPKNHQVTQLIIKDMHERRLHGGTNEVLAELPSRFWIIAAREVIRIAENKLYGMQEKQVQSRAPSDGTST